MTPNVLGCKEGLLEAIAPRLCSLDLVHMGQWVNAPRKAVAGLPTATKLSFSAAHNSGWPRFPRFPALWISSANSLYVLENESGVRKDFLIIGMSSRKTTKRSV